MTGTEKENTSTNQDATTEATEIQKLQHTTLTKSSWKTTVTGNRWKRGVGGGGRVDKGNQSDGPIHLAKLIDASLGGSNCGLN